MDLRLGRSVAAITVIAVLGVVALRHRATELRSHLAARIRDRVPAADSDSAAVIAAALRALRVDDSTQGATGAGDTVARRVLRFERDSAGVLVTLVPLDPLSPADGALIRVLRSGTDRGRARLVERYPGH
jgi:hypothetical protein